MQVGIIVPYLAPAQLSFLAVGQCNRAVRNGHEPIIFFENVSPMNVPTDFSMMNISEIWSFEGVMVATTLSSANLLRKAPNPSFKIFYVWDLEWLRGQMDFEKNVEIYRDENIKLVARSRSHAEAIEKYCNRKVDFVTSNLDVERMMEKFECNSQKQTVKFL